MTKFLIYLQPKKNKCISSRLLPYFFRPKLGEYKKKIYILYLIYSTRLRENEGKQTNNNNNKIAKKKIHKKKIKFKETVMNFKEIHIGECIKREKRKKNLFYSSRRQCRTIKSIRKFNKHGEQLIATEFRNIALNIVIEMI